MDRRFMMPGRWLAATLTCGLLSAPAPARAQAMPEPSTPPEMVATYNTLADGILALKRTEENLVRSIVAAADAHGEVQLMRAERALAAGDASGAKAAVEALAAAVGQIATEGDNSVAAVRKRLLEGGHHHNAAGEAQGIFDEGFVIVTKAAKQKLLESSRRIGQMASSASAAGLDSEWASVQAVYKDLMPPAK